MVNLSFDQKNIAFTGQNGAGKTNLLDAIYYLTLGKSNFNSIDQQNILHNEDFFNLKADFSLKDEINKLFCAFVRGKKKALKVNEQVYDKISHHVGRFPAVIITPYDQELILGGSEERRKFIDLIISQTSNDYLEQLMRYNRALTQRNALLKRMFEEKRKDISLLDAYNRILVETGDKIYDKRTRFIEEFSGHFYDSYRFISNEQEKVDVTYKSQLQTNSFLHLLENNLEKDILLQRTTAGIHKDDMELTKDQMPAKKFTSQGQQKSVLISMKLAQYKMLENRNGFPPLLLIDDLFDRLDENRSLKFLQKIAQNDFGQVFITDTSPTRIRQQFGKINREIQVFTIDDGVVK